MGLSGMGCNMAPVVAEVDIRLKAGHPLARNARALQASNQFFALPRKHRPGDHLKGAGESGEGWEHGRHTPVMLAAKQPVGILQALRAQRRATGYAGHTSGLCR